MLEAFRPTGLVLVLEHLVSRRGRLTTEIFRVRLRLKRTQKKKAFRAVGRKPTAPRQSNGISVSSEACLSHSEIGSDNPCYIDTYLSVKVY